MKTNKGEYGYFRREKKRRALITLALFAAPLLVFFGGVFYFKDRNNYLTVFAVVACLPACKSAVGLLMAMLQKSLDPSVYEPIEKAGSGLMLVYELLITTQEKNAYIEAVAICGNEVVGYVSDKKADVKFIAGYIQKILRGNGYGVNVRLLQEMNPYLERLESLREHRESLEKEIRFTPHPDHPEVTRDEWIRDTLLAIAL